MEMVVNKYPRISSIDICYSNVNEIVLKLFAIYFKLYT